MSLVSPPRASGGPLDLFDGSREGVLSFTRKNGDEVVYRVNTNEFGVRSKDGTIRTYFAPNDGLQYYIDELNKP